MDQLIMEAMNEVDLDSAPTMDDFDLEYDNEGAKNLVNALSTNIQDWVQDFVENAVNIRESIATAENSIQDTDIKRFYKNWVEIVTSHLQRMVAQAKQVRSNWREAKKALEDTNIDTQIAQAKEKMVRGMKLKKRNPDWDDANEFIDEIGALIKSTNKAVTNAKSQLIKAFDGASQSTATTTPSPALTFTANMDQLQQDLYNALQVQQNLKTKGKNSDANKMIQDIEQAMEDIDEAIEDALKTRKEAIQKMVDDWADLPIYNTKEKEYFYNRIILDTRNWKELDELVGKLPLVNTLTKKFKGSILKMIPLLSTRFLRSAYGGIGGRAVAARSRTTDYVEQDIANGLENIVNLLTQIENESPKNRDYSLGNLHKVMIQSGYTNPRTDPKTGAKAPSEPLYISTNFNMMVKKADGTETILRDKDKKLKLMKDISKYLTGIDPKDRGAGLDIAADPMKDPTSKKIAGSVNKYLKRNPLEQLFQQELGNALFNKLKALSEGLLKEDMGLLDLFDFDALFKNPNISPAEIDNVGTAIKKVYNLVSDPSQYNTSTGIHKLSPAGNTTDTMEELKSTVKQIYDSYLYYKSGRKLRTTPAPKTDYTLKTAATAGSIRAPYELVRAFEKAFPGNTLQARLNSLQSWLSTVGTLPGLSDKKLVREAAVPSVRGITGGISKQFSKWVILELLHDMLTSPEEEGAKGYLFEAFLTYLTGGTQTGASMGAGDFTYQEGGMTIQGSAKLYSSNKFGQALSNLKALDTVNAGDSFNSNNFMRYVVGLKYGVDVGYAGDKEFTQKASGQRTAKIDFYTIDVIRIADDPAEFATLLNTHGDPAQGATFTGQPADYVTEKSRSGDESPQVNFLAGSKVSRGGVLTADIQFLVEYEFEDISDIILKDIDEQLNDAMTAISCLRSNMNRWVVDEDIMAFDKVQTCQVDLDNAITHIATDASRDTTPTPPTSPPTTENLKKSIKELDKLIEQVILNKVMEE